MQIACQKMPCQQACLKANPLGSSMLANSCVANPWIFWHLHQEVGHLFCLVCGGGFGISSRLGIAILCPAVDPE